MFSKKIIHFSRPWNCNCIKMNTVFFHNFLISPLELYFRSQSQSFFFPGFFFPLFFFSWLDSLKALLYCSFWIIFSLINSTFKKNSVFFYAPSSHSSFLYFLAWVESSCLLQSESTSHFLLKISMVMISIIYYHSFYAHLLGDVA